MPDRRVMRTWAQVLDDEATALARVRELEAALRVAETYVPDRSFADYEEAVAALAASPVERGLREFDTVIPQDDGVWCDENGPAAGGAEGDTQ